MKLDMLQATQMAKWIIITTESRNLFPYNLFFLKYCSTIAHLDRGTLRRKAEWEKVHDLGKYELD